MPDPIEAPPKKKSDTASPRAPARAAVDLGQAIIRSFATSERINQMLLENLPPKAWRAEPPGARGRTIAGIVAHLNNVRHLWLEVAARGTDIPVPEKLDGATVTLAKARAALKRSSLSMIELLRRSIAAGGHVRDFKPDVVAFLAYSVSHEAHHRGQILLLAKQQGFAVPQEVSYALWDWKARDLEAASPKAKPKRAPKTEDA